MKIKQLRAALAKIGKGFDDVEVKVWLPGSTIRLGDHIFPIEDKGILAIEGNVDPGSALDRE